MGREWKRNEKGKGVRRGWELTGSSSILSGGFRKSNNSDKIKHNKKVRKGVIVMNDISKGKQILAKFLKTVRFVILTLLSHGGIVLNELFQLLSDK